MQKFSVLLVFVALPGCGAEPAIPTSSTVGPDERETGADVATMQTASDTRAVTASATPEVSCPERCHLGQFVVIEMLASHPQGNPLQYEIRVTADDGQVYRPIDPRFNEFVASGEVVQYQDDFTSWGPGTYEVQARTSDGTAWSSWSDPQTIVCEIAEATAGAGPAPSTEPQETVHPETTAIETDGSETPPPGPPWQHDFLAAQSEALSRGKPVFVYFTKTY